jgi:uncharacterized protein YpmS
MLKAGSSEWKVTLLVLLAILLAGVIAVTTAGWRPLSGEEEVLLGYVDAEPMRIQA